MAERNLDTLFHDTLKDIYYAERTILKALPKMARGAQSPKLKQAFEKHKDETQGQVERLQQVFEIIGKRAQGKTCPAIDGIVEGGNGLVEGDVVNDLIGVVADPNVFIQESKVATCDIRPGRRPRGPALLEYIAAYRREAGITPETGTDLDTTKPSTEHTEDQR